MIAGLSSGVATAIRTAGEARATMDRASREIATGQRVSSAKDDGAAWVRASGLKSAQVEADTIRLHTGLVRTWAEPRREAGESAKAMWSDIRSAVLALAQPGLSAETTARLRLQAQTLFAQEAAIAWSAYSADTVENGVPDVAIANARSILTVRDSSGQDLLGGRVSSSFLPTSTPGNRTFSGSLIDNVSAYSAPVRTNPGGSFTEMTFNGWMVPRLDSAAEIQGALGFVTAAIETAGIEMGQIAGTARALERLGQRMARRSDGLETSIGQLTDADLGKASTTRAQAETRQQLALQTVRQALDAYGSYAGGLLGNVQRTQRAIA